MAWTVGTRIYENFKVPWTATIPESEKKKHQNIIELKKQTRRGEILSLSSRFPTSSEAETLEYEALLSISQTSALSSSTNPPQVKHVKK